MRIQPFPLKTLISFSSSAPSLCSLSIFVSHFSTSQTHPLHSHPFSRRHEEESRHVKVSVWWDFENCHPPANCNVFKIANIITAALRANGIMGPLQITAFGDILQLSRANQEALSSTGINVSHVPNGGKNSADRSLLVDLMNWISQNPPPAHLFLISGDRDFASILHRLRMNNYNILLASPENQTPGVLCSAASIMWNWNTLLKSEELTGKYYNQPPDGPYGSWYGHYKVSLQDPFLVEQPEESSKDSESKPRQVSKAVTDKIRKVLDSCPKGISITDLRSELIRCNVSLDKDFYGYKKFSSFLLSMPHILWLQSKPDGQFVIHGITPKADELSESSPGLSAGPVCRDGDNRLIVSSRSSDAALNNSSRLQHCSRSKILADCRKLVEEILREHPKGYHMGGFKDLFLEKYGYPLDVQSLGYKKLASLLEIIPGVKIVLTYIIPASKVPDNSSLETDVPYFRENASRALGKTACELPSVSTTGDHFDSNRKEV